MSKPLSRKRSSKQNRSYVKITIEDYMKMRDDIRKLQDEVRLLHATLIEDKQELTRMYLQIEKEIG